MVHGTLEVLLVGAKGLENTDYLCTRLSSSFSTFPYFADQLCIGDVPLLFRMLVRFLVTSFSLAIEPAGNMDPYAILKCRSQEQRSSIAAGGHLHLLYLSHDCQYFLCLQC
jgi:hypothetical protein